jgi:osmotically inducible protein OsmC
MTDVTLRERFSTRPVHLAIWSVPGTLDEPTPIEEGDAAMPVRTSDAQWNGTLREGEGTMRFGGGAFEGQYNFGSRFEEGTGTNPEELIAAAHAGCFSMALSGDLGKAGYTPTSVRTSAKVHVEKQETGFAITRIELNSKADVPGIDPDEFQKVAEGTRTGCPVSRALASVPIELTATLV